MPTTIKISTLSSLIKKANFDWTNIDITDSLFKKPEEVSSDFKLYHFGRNISSEYAIAEMAKDGYRPANAWELVSYARDGWNGRNLILGLGSVGEVNGSRRVPCLYGGGSERNLYLFWLDRDWSADYRFLGVRNSSSALGISVPGPLDTRNLEARVAALEQKLEAIAKILG